MILGRPPHLIASQPGDKKPGLHTYFFGALLVAFILCPFLAIVFWWQDIGDNGNSTGGYTPDPFWVDFLVAAMMCLFVGFLSACVLVLFVLLIRKLSGKQLAHVA
jgi:hypothetical protein